MRFSFLLLLLACGGQDAGPDEPGLTTTNEAQAPAPPAEGVQAPTVALPDMPAGVRVEVDSESSTFGFVGAKVTKEHPGGFKSYKGLVVVDEAGAVVGTAFQISLDSVFSDSEKLTKHLKDTDFFHVEQYTNARFASADIQAAGEGYTVQGVLDLHGVSKTLSFPANIEVAEDKVHVTAEFDLNRQDFGISYPGKPDNLIKDQVKIQLDLNFPRK